jgi:hypothetical protein
MASAWPYEDPPAVAPDRVTRMAEWANGEAEAWRLAGRLIGALEGEADLPLVFKALQLDSRGSVCYSSGFETLSPRQADEQGRVIEALHRAVTKVAKGGPQIACPVRLLSRFTDGAILYGLERAYAEAHGTPIRLVAPEVMPKKSPS